MGRKRTRTAVRKLRTRGHAAGVCAHAHWQAVAGSASGFAQVAAEQPFDTVKVRLQSRIPTFNQMAGCAPAPRQGISFSFFLYSFQCGLAGHRIAGGGE